MKKVILGFFAVLFAGQLCYAQPVSDMAVIPMGITVRSIMRLDVTKGGNIEFVFSRIAQLTTGIAFSSSYETRGTISASQNFDLTLTTDGLFSDGVNPDLALNVVDYQWPAAGDIPPATTTIPAGAGAAQALAASILLVDDGTLGANIPFGVQWQCGVTVGIGGTPAGRYTTNVILSLTAN